MHQELHSHSGGVVLVWHRKSNMLFLQFPKPTPPHPHNNTMPSYNNNNNNGCMNNCYVVLVPTIALTSSRPASAGNCQQLACAAAAKAAKCEKDRIMAARICQAASQPGFLCAASGSKSSGANNGSHSSGPSVCPMSHIRRSTITPLPSSDRMRRSKTGLNSYGFKVNPKKLQISDLF